VTYKGKLYGTYMRSIYISYMSCIWILNTNEMQVIYVPYMYMASIWELYGFKGQFLQPTYIGLTMDI